MQAALFLRGDRFDLFHLKFEILAALFVVLAGLAGAVVHLGKPGASFHAIRNFKRSWLSREIFTVTLFAGILAIMAVLTHVRPGALNGWVMLMASLAGGAVLYAMTRLYRLRTVPSWNHAGTPLNFLGSALLLGGLLFTLVLNIVTVIPSIDHNALGADVSRNIAFIAALVGLMLKVPAAGVNPSGRADSAAPFKTLQPVMQGCGVALWTVSILSGGSPGFQTALLSLAAVSVVAGEIIHRIQFYDTYHRVGL